MDLARLNRALSNHRFVAKAKSLVLDCDYCAAAGTFWALSRTEATRLAEAAGWKRENDRNSCPKCSANRSFSPK